jgi:hypothetical protein
MNGHRCWSSLHRSSSLPSTQAALRAWSRLCANTPSSIME